MRTVLRSIFAVSVIITLTSCPSDTSIELSVSPSSITLDNNNQGEISIISNTSWNIRSTETWLTSSTNSGMGDRQVTIRATSDNTGDQPRNGQIVISDKTNTETRTISVSQLPAQNSPTIKYKLELSKSSISFNSDASENSFNVTADQSWTASSSQSWCSISPPSGNSSGTVIVSVSANTGYDNRNAIITVSAYDGKMRTVQISQSGITDTEIKPGEDDNTPPVYSRMK